MLIHNRIILRAKDDRREVSNRAAYRYLRRMTWIAVELVLASAFMHAAWNYHGKSRNPSAAFFLLATASGALCLSPLLLIFRQQLVAIPAQVWWLLVLTGFFQALYFFALAMAYHYGAMSLAYPLARSISVVLVTLVTLSFGLGGQIGPSALVGIACVVVGCFILPMKRFGQWRLKHYLNRCCLMALLAAVGTAGYSIIDDHALRLLRQVGSEAMTKTTAPMIYIALEGMMSSTWLALALLCLPNQRRQLGEVIRTSKASALFMGTMIWATYVLVLAAMAFTTNVSYIVALRQFSILIGVAMAILLLKEPCPRPKALGLAVMLVGLVLVATG
jgi:drug/metabolite transporter (DMT)-like permease